MTRSSTVLDTRTSPSPASAEILADVDATERTIEEIVAYVVTEDYDGFDLDLDGVRPDDRAAFSAFTARLGGTP